MKYRGKRRGSVYLMVLMAAALVTTIGLSALLISRVTNKSMTWAQDSAEARLYAISGVDRGLLLIHDNPDDWRDQLAPGSIPTNQAIGRGSFSLTATDLDGGSIGSSDEVLLTGTGSCGGATYRLQIQIDADGAVVLGTWKRITN